MEQAASLKVKLSHVPKTENVAPGSGLPANCEVAVPVSAPVLGSTVAVTVSV